MVSHPTWAGARGNDCNDNGVDDASEIRRTEWAGAVTLAEIPDLIHAQVADLDADTSLDLVALSHDEITIVWDVLHDKPPEQTDIAVDLANPFGAAFRIADLDGDGDLDLVLVLLDQSVPGLWIVENRGDRDLELQETAIVKPAFSLLEMDDFNGDQRLDFIVVDQGRRMLLAMQNEDGSFLSEPAVVADDVGARASRSAGDFDGDGDRDLLYSPWLSSSTLQVLENQGDGTFLPGVAISTDDGRIRTFSSGDIDGDGRDEIIVESASRVWLVSVISHETFSITELTEAAEADFVTVADTNGDEAPEVLLFGRRGAKVLVHSGQGDFDEEFELALDYKSPFVSRVDDDQFSDVVAVQGNRAVYLRGDGADTLWTHRSYDLLGNLLSRLSADDFDGDGDDDVVVSSVDTRFPLVTVLASDDRGRLTSEYFSVSARPCSLASADLEGDELPEIVVATENGLDIYTRRESGGYGRRTLDADGACAALTLADVDADSDLDILVASPPRILANQSRASFGAPTRIVPGASYRRAGVADVDRDGIPDILGLTVASGSSNELVVFRGLGRLLFDVVDRFASRATALVTADFNGDGAVDVAANNDGFADLRFNRGGGRIDFQRSYRLPSQFSREIDAGDLDADGDIDLVVSDGSAPTALINFGNGVFRERPIPFAGNTQDGEIADVDGDGLNDLILIHRTSSIAVTRRVVVIKNRMVSGVEPDCDSNSVLDECELEGDDCDRNEVLDSCEPDADFDGVADGCDVCAGSDDALDSDADGTPNCLDLCPRDSNKVAPLFCGCGAPEVDSDGDMVPDCVDNCADDSNPSQADLDEDGFGDACDECVDDGIKAKPLVCGCGVSEVDRDSDFTPDCVDACPFDREVIEPGPCPCRTSFFEPPIDRADRDRDDVPNCIDNCIEVENQDQADSDRDGVGDACDDRDGPACLGDCGGDLSIGVSDFEAAVVALFDADGRSPGCGRLDFDRDGAVRANDLVALARAIELCVDASPSPTPTATASPVPTATPPVGRMELGFGSHVDVCRTAQGPKVATVTRRAILVQDYDDLWSPVGEPLAIEVDAQFVALACTAAGAAMVVWQEEVDDFDTDVKARFISADEARLGDEFLVDERIENGQWDPAVDCNPQGVCLATWNDGRLRPQRVFGRFFEIGIGHVDRPLTISSRPGPASNPGVASLSSGRFATVAEDEDLFVVRLGADGFTDEPRVLLSDRFSAGRQTAIAVGPADRLAVVAAEGLVDPRLWIVNDEQTPMHIERPLGNFQVVSDPAVAFTDDGTVVVALDRWVGQDRRVAFQLFDPDGLALVDLREVAPVSADQVALRTDDQTNPKLIAHGDGGFSVLWTQYVSVFVRRFDRAGDPVVLSGRR